MPFSRHPFLRTIRGRILAALLLCGIVPAALVQVVNHLQLSSSLETSECAKYESLNSLVVRQIGAVMRTAESQLRLLRDNPVLVNPDSSEAARLEEMQRIVRAAGSFSDISLYTADGLFTKSTSDLWPEPVDRTDWMRRARDGEPCLSSPQKILGAEGLYISIYLPVKSAPGQRPPAIIKGRLPFAPATEALLTSSELPPGASMVLIDANGNFIGHSDSTKILRKLDVNRPADSWLKPAIGIYTDSDGRAYTSIAAMVSQEETRIGEPWYLVTLIPQSELTAAAARGRLSFVLAGFFSLLLALSSGVWLSRKLSQPVIAVARAARAVAGGNLECPIPNDPGAPEEFAQLSSAFNRMVRELRSHRDGLQNLVDERTASLSESQYRLENVSAQLRAAFDATREAILILAPDGRIIAANSKFREFFGIDPETYRQQHFAAFESRLFGVFQDGASFSEKWRYAFGREEAHDTGWAVLSPKKRVVSSYTVPVLSRTDTTIGQLWMFRDITRQRELQSGLEQAQKMEAVGRLAGGIAHDFNNLLTGILGNLNLADDQLTDSGVLLSLPGRAAAPPVRQHLQLARTAGERAAGLVKQLLGFSRRSQLVLAAVDANALCQEVKDLLRATLDPRHQLEVVPTLGLWPVLGDATQIDQVLMNMAVNARDAIGDRGGVISFTTSNTQVSAGHAGRHGCPAGEYTRISVTDNGPGMPPSVMEKIFEPFYTTKEQGKGTGLGLATSFGIVNQHGGWIECQSVLGTGTTFHIYLPRCKTASMPPARPKTMPLPMLTPGGKTGTILLIDDEPLVRSIAEAVLKREGYRVLTADDGVEGIEVFRKNLHDVSLIMLDLTMPRLSGRDTFIELKRLDPEIPVLICSGYMVEIEEFEKETGFRPSSFVPKPYAINELSLSVHTVLEDIRTVTLMPS